MPRLGAHLDFAQLEGQNFRAHQLGGAPGSPVKGQVYFNTGDNTLYWYDGTGWVSARGGASATPQATTTTQGTIQLAGDLAGTATSPQIAAGVITDAEVAAANKDGAVGTASMRTLGAGAAQAMPGNRTLDAITPPVSSVNMNGQVLYGLPLPISDNYAASKLYVDNVASGLDAKQSVRAATTANVASILSFPSNVVDGITLAVDDRVLVKNQTNATENGIYAVGPLGWVRAPDADTFNDLVSAFVFVEQGTTNADSGWVSTADAGGTLGSTTVTWVQFSGAGSISAGAGLTKTGNVLDVGAGAGITVNADTIQVANDGITNAMMADNAITHVEVAAANKDGVVATPSMRTLGAGAQQAMPGNRTLDAVPSPTSSVNMNSQRLNLVGDPTLSTDGANKKYVDDLVYANMWKQPARLVATANIGGSPPGGPQTIDGVAVVNGDKVLLTAQTVPADNGLWGVNTGGTWNRTLDADSSAELAGAIVYVSGGTTKADTVWSCTTDAPITVGTTPLTWVQFAGSGAVADATTGSKGVIQLAGDLAGTAASPQIAAGVITDAEVAAANKDGVVGTASMRTLGAGAQQAMPGNRTLDAVTAPAADLNLNSRKITALADPTAATDGANKQYVDNTVQGLSAKASVWAASTVDVPMTSGGGGYSIDGAIFNTVSSGARNRVLLKNQTNPVENGIYIVSGSAGGTQTLARANDMDSMVEFPGAYCWVESGTTNAETGWVCTTDPVAGTTIVSNAWTQFSGAGQITAGAGLTKTGNTIDIGAGAGITVDTDSIRIANNAIVNGMIADGAINLGTSDVTGTLTLANGGTNSNSASGLRTNNDIAGWYVHGSHGAGTTISIPQATHGLRASMSLVVQCQIAATGEVVLPDITVSAGGDVTISFGASQAANSIRTTILG